MGTRERKRDTRHGDTGLTLKQRSGGATTGGADTGGRWRGAGTGGRCDLTIQEIFSPGLGIYSSWEWIW